MITLTFGGDPISKSPFAVGVAAPLDLSKIKVDGLESRKYSFSYIMGLLTCFIVCFTTVVDSVVLLSALEINVN